MKFSRRLLYSVLPLIIIPLIVGVGITILHADASLRKMALRLADLELEFFLARAEEEYRLIRNLGIDEAEFYRANAQQRVVEYARERTIPGAVLYILEGERVIYLPAEARESDRRIEREFAPWGWKLGVSVSRRYLASFIAESLAFVLLLLALLVLPIVYSTLLLSRRMSRPIERLKDTARALAGGDLSVRAREEGDVEIASLARTFNSVAENLQILTRDLEGQVHDRTRALEESLRELRDTQEKLIEREKLAALGGVVAGVAHEINTPLGICVTSSTFLREKIDELEKRLAARDLTETQLKDFAATADDSSRIIYRNLDRAHHLISTFKQLAVDQTSGQEREFDLAEYLADIVYSLQHHFKNTRVRTEIDAPEAVFYFGNPGFFYQIFTNLILNSLIHGFSDGREGVISIACRRAGAGVVIEYRDDGEGMEPEQVAHIFEPFYTTRRGKGGSGLGMNIVYNLIVKNLKGEIRVESARGEGVVIYIDLPGRQAG